MRRTSVCVCRSAVARRYQAHERAERGLRGRGELGQELASGALALGCALSRRLEPELAGEGPAAAAGVGAGRLAELVVAARLVQHVVHDLEQQPELDAEGARRDDLPLPRPGHDRATGGTGAEQGAGLEAGGALQA